MPFIKLEAGKMDKDQKEKLMSAFTKLASETLGIAKENFIVLIQERMSLSINAAGDDNRGCFGLLTTPNAPREKKWRKR